ncbi:MAG: hypothetical protein ACLRVT_06680 [Oscillospiraceae bacterium]
MAISPHHRETGVIRCQGSAQAASACWAAVEVAAQRLGMMLPALYCEGAMLRPYAA